jgi:hypothetical protein
MKKRRIYLTLCFLFTACTLHAQDIKAGWGNLDYAIPNSPAFNILGTEPDNILKPTATRTVAFSVGNYFITNGNVIPKSLAVEISPMLLLNNKQNLTAYKKNLFWNRMRISFGTAQQLNGGYGVAEGIKFTILDKTDLRANETFIKGLKTYTLGMAVDKDKILKNYTNEHPEKSYTYYSEQYDDDPAFKKIIDDRLKVTDNTVNPDTISKYRDYFKNKLWNAPIWEVGFATLQTSKDSLIKNLQFSKIGFWSSAGLPISNKGQILIGVKAGLKDSIKVRSEFAVGSRLYYGSNQVRGYLQAEYQRNDNNNQGVFGLGFLFNVSAGLWAQAALNIIIKDGRALYSPGINIGFGSSEKTRP